MMTPLDLEFERALHYQDEGYEGDNDHGLPPQIIRPIWVYSIFTTKASFNPVDFATTQCLISPFTPRHPGSLPFWEGICWCLTFDEMPLPMPETVDAATSEESEDDKEPLPTADHNDWVWGKEPVP